MLLAQPGIEEALDSWHRRSHLSGWLADFFDSAVSKSLLGPDGLPFFQRDKLVDPEGELRIGLALGIDWFVSPPSRCSCVFILSQRILPGSRIFAVSLRRRTPRVLCPLA